MQYGFNGRIFPLIGFIVGMSSIFGSYYLAISKTPPDIKPFPWTDITHTGIKYPEYLPLRIGLLSCSVLFAISFQVLKNFLVISSCQIVGQPDSRLSKFSLLSIASCICLAVSTATISDGGDMNWTLHVFGASSFFIIAFYLIMEASAVYRELYVIKHFCPFWSYQIKKFTNFFIVAFVFLQLLEIASFIQIGSLVEWLATFFLLAYFFTLWQDCKNMNIFLVEK